MYRRGQIILLNLRAERKYRYGSPTRLFPYNEEMGRSEKSNESGNLSMVLCISSMLTNIISFKSHSNLVTQTLLLPF